MITLYSGTPGSGKSYHAARDLIKRFKRGGGVISNFPVKVPPSVRPRSDLRVSYWDNSDITPYRLSSYALKHHSMGVEGQTLVVLDEAQVIFNCRDFNARDRRDWIKFFTQHRKLGFNILLITQNDRMLDRQIRVLIENECKHRKLNNYGFGGGLLQLLSFGSTWFISIEYWYGGNKLLLSREIFRYSPTVAAVYDSYRMFDDSDGNNSLLQLSGVDRQPHEADRQLDPDLNCEKIASYRYRPFKKSVAREQNGGDGNAVNDDAGCGPADSVEYPDLGNNNAGAAALDVD